MTAADAPQWGACGSRRCSARLRFVPLVDGTLIGCDVTVEPDGLLVPAIGAGGGRIVVPRGPEHTGRAGFVPHWLTCPDGRFWAVERAAGEAAIAGRAPATSPGAAGPRALDRGPCAGCRRPDHVAYGPHSTGTLCPRCRAVLAAWRAGGGAGELVYPVWSHG